MNISSIVVQVKPENYDAVKENIRKPVVCVSIILVKKKKVR